MIVEKRRYIRNLSAAKLNSLVKSNFYARRPSGGKSRKLKDNHPMNKQLDSSIKFNFYAQFDWDDEPVKKNVIPPWLIVHVFALLSGLSAYAIVSYFF